MSNDPGSPLGARSTTIAGIVVDEDGAPAPGADVRVLMRSFVRADSNGRFEVEGLEPGEYEIVADWVGPWFAPRKNAAQQAVHAGDVDVRLVLPTGATVTGRAMLDGKPLTYFGLRLVGERETPSGALLDAISPFVEGAKGYWRAVLTIGELGEAARPVVPALIRALQNPNLRTWACISLEKLGPDLAGDAVSLLEGLAAQDKREGVRNSRAAQALDTLRRR